MGVRLCTQSNVVKEENSYRQILRSSSIIGGASVINIVIGLLRTKIAAVLLGPSGVGLIGLFYSLQATASTIAGLGLSTVGTRQIAEAGARADESEIAASRRTLFWGTLSLSILGGVVFWSLRDLLATHVLNDPAKAGQIGWLAIGVALTVASGSQTAMLNGLRRIGDLARISIGSGVFATVFGVVVLLKWGEQGVMLFVLGAPLGSMFLGSWYVIKLGKLHVKATPLNEISKQFAAMINLGVAFMASGVVVAAGQLFVRTMVQHQLGAEDLGQFQASWAISMTYIGLILGAMGTDYYPRLSGIIHDYPAVNRLVNEQTEVALLLAAPVLLAILGLAPLVIQLLYTSAFTEAVSILRWQILGDLMKVCSWPLGFILLAAGAGRGFFLTELLAMAIFVTFTGIGIPLFGVQATGIGFFVMYAVYLPVVYYLARRRTGFRWDPRVIKKFKQISAAGLVIFFSTLHSELLSGLVSVGMATMFSVVGISRVGEMIDLPMPIKEYADNVRQILSRLNL